MLLRPELIDRLAETLEGIPMTLSDEPVNGQQRREASILVYHSGTAQSGRAPVAGESPLLDINIVESGSCSVLVNSALGMVELHEIEEIRLLEVTEEAAFYSRNASGRTSLLTLSSRGTIQIYVNIDEALGEMELSDVADEDLRAAVALKIFSENAEVFISTVEKV